ncbi:melanotransferrin-like [Ctenocephalides felis]|uniref:melanotransferrin-like n=1 Tax=Ctenocephalides felis TaxID=7515 RepID=UPI000E6E3A51|nr:melanotransferrin-like [Ctenocephalides felis]
MFYFNFINVHLLIISLYAIITSSSLGQELKEEEQITWCTVTLEEQYKCQNLTKALERDRALFKEDFLTLKCLQGFNKQDCMTLLDSEKAHFVTLDAGDVFIAGRYNSLIPIMQEQYDGGFKYFYAVAVVKTGTIPEVTRLSDLRGVKACFAGVGYYASWVLPIHVLMQMGGMQIIDCNNHVKSAIEYFGPSCAVNSLTDKYNPIGDNSDKLCSLCTGKVAGGKCTSKDPYAGYEGAFRCLLEAGDIAFLRHDTVQQMIRSKEFRSVQESRFELLCTDGTRKPISEYRQCNWGTSPSDAIVTTSAHNYENRYRYTQFLKQLASRYSYARQSNYNNTQFGSNSNNDFNRDQNFNPDYNRNSGFQDYNRNNQGSYNNNNRFNNNYGRDLNNDYDPYNNTYRNLKHDSIDNDYGERYNASADPSFYEKFDLFESNRYVGRLNLMFQDTSIGLVSLPENKQTYIGYLDKALDSILEVRQCTVNRMTLCVTSEAEMEKCIKMRTAMKAQLLKPEMTCYKSHSHIHCMQAIQSGVADVTVLDASDVYTAGLRYELIPIISEVYNLGEPEYYVVAVAKEEDADTELTYLKGKNTCHTGINTAAGWVYPMAYLLANGWIRPYGCDSMRAASEYFSKSCIPGALSTEYNVGVPYDNMCDLCHGASFRYCRRDAAEDYYGHTGAFRCLVEGGGHVAFVKHTTVSENTGGKRREWWARNTLNDDFQLLCPDGTRASMKEYMRCNLGLVKANAVVTRGGYAYNETQINAYINLFIYAQQYYGRKDLDDFSFSMFYSTPPYSDLIFQDATQQLQVIKPEKRRYDLYLGQDFMRARRIVDCQAGASSNKMHVFSLFISLMFTLKISTMHC